VKKKRTGEYRSNFSDPKNRLSLFHFPISISFRLHPSIPLRYSIFAFSFFPLRPSSFFLLFHFDIRYSIFDIRYSFFVFRLSSYGPACNRASTACLSLSSG